MAMARFVYDEAIGALLVTEVPKTRRLSVVSDGSPLMSMCSVTISRYGRMG